MGFTEFIDGVLNWIEALLSGRVGAIIAALAVIGTFLGVIATIVAILQRRGRRMLDEYLKLLQRELAAKETEVKEKQLVLEERERAIKAWESELDRVRIAVLQSDEKLWEIRKPRPFPGYHTRINERRPLVMTIGNLKGGVGKTTLAANLAADWAIAEGKRVLLMDLDYQGSLSSMMFSAAGRTDVLSQVEAILDGLAQPGNLANVASYISLQLPKLPNTWIIPGYYSLAARENQIMVQWISSAAIDDVRYRLARFLLDDRIRQQIDLVILDTPPRLTAGTVNALCASTHLLVPTKLDRLSAEAVGPFLNAVKNLKNQVNPSMEFVGVVGTMTQQQHRLSAVEANALELIRGQLEKVWPQNPHTFNRHIPQKAAFARAAGQTIAYLEDKEIRQFIHELGQEIRSRM